MIVAGALATSARRMAKREAVLGRRLGFATSTRPRIREQRIEDQPGRAQKRIVFVCLLGFIGLRGRGPNARLTWDREQRREEKDKRGERRKKDTKQKPKKE